MSANIRESLYQCLENKISLENDAATTHYFFLFKIKDDAVFNIKIHFDLASTFTATPINKKYNGYNQICFGNGTVHINQGDNVVPFYKLNQAHFEHVITAGNIANTITITNVNTNVDNNIASIEYRRIHDNGYYKYYAIVSYNQGSDKDKLDSRDLVVRKEIAYGNFDELLSKKVNATEVTEAEEAVRITVVSQSTNDVSNGQYVDAEDNIFAYNIVAKDYSYTETGGYAHTQTGESYLSKILGFSKEYAYDILAENTLGVGLRYVGADSDVENKYFFKVDNNGNTVIGNAEQTDNNKASLHVYGASSLDGDVTTNGKVTAANVESTDGTFTNLSATNITATKVECGYTSSIKDGTTTLLNITKNNNVYSATGELVASNTDSFEPENTDLKLARIKDLSLYKGTDKVVKVGTITSGTWNGSTIENNYIATDLTGKSYNGINISSADNKIGFTNGSTKLTVSADSNYTLGAACTYDAIDTVTSGSNNLVTSGAVYTSVNAVDNKLGDQVTYSYNSATGVLTITSKTTS